MSSAAVASKPYARLSIPEDCHELALSMRYEDRQELEHAGGYTPLAALLMGYRNSTMCWSVVWQGKVVAMFGYSGTRGEVGVPWMLASEDLKHIRKSFLRECRDYVELMQLDHPVLTNLAWSKNTVHLEWLRWLGFTLLPPAPIREGGEPFIRFYKVKEHV